MKRPATFLDLINQIPPPVARALARRRLVGKRLVPITAAEIATSSGLTLGRVTWISIQPTWSSVPIGEADRFLAGCGITLQRWAAERRYIRKTQMSESPLAHLSKVRSSSRRSIELAWQRLASAAED